MLLVSDRQLRGRCSCHIELPIAIKIAVSLEVAQTRNSTTVNVDIINSDVLAAARTAQDIIVSTLISSSTGDVSDDNILDKHTCGRVARWATVEVVLLNVDSIDRDVLNADVLEQNVVDVAGGVLVGLDAGTVLSV